MNGLLRRRVPANQMRWSETTTRGLALGEIGVVSSPLVGRGRLVKADRPRQIDRYIDYFGGPTA